MANKQTVFSLLMGCTLGIFVSLNAAQGATITAASVAFDDVSEAIDSASYNDTVLIPAGSATWSNKLKITKAIKLAGAGKESTVITSDLDYIFLYQPDFTTISKNYLFECSQMKLDGVGGTPTDGIIIDTARADICRIKIHDMEFANLHRALDAGNPLAIGANIYGVVYNCEFTGGSNLIYALGNQRSSWDNLPKDYGTDANLYFEDNIIRPTLNNSGFIGGGHGGRYVVRYNTYYGQNDNDTGIWDIHGNQPGVYAMMVVEVYGNYFPDYVNGCNGFDHRGGKALFFFNRFDGRGTKMALQCREEYDDAISPCNGCTQHIHDSYYWNNRLNGNLLPVTMVQNNSSAYQIGPNKDWWIQSGSFDGTSGVGAGPLSSRPATCTPGTAYWATNQPVDEVSLDNIGANPKAPIEGTLYKCTAANTWTAYYTPFQYPHPLRGPDIPSNLKLIK